VADTKDFLVKLEPALGSLFQTLCKSEGRSQQSVFCQIVSNYIHGGNNPQGSQLVAGLLEELIDKGIEYQQALMDDMQEERLANALLALQERKALRSR